MALDQREGDKGWCTSRAQVDAVKKASAQALQRLAGQGGALGERLFFLCATSSLPARSRCGRRGRGGQFTHARTAPKPHLCGHCFACVRERAVRISSACLPGPGLLVPLSLARCGCGGAGTRPPPPAATAQHAPTPRCRGTAQAPASPDFRATLRRNRGVGVGRGGFSGSSNHHVRCLPSVFPVTLARLQRASGTGRWERGW